LHQKVPTIFQEILLLAHGRKYLHVTARAMSITFSKHVLTFRGESRIQGRKEGSQVWDA